MIEFCGIALAHRIVNGSGTFDAIAAHRAFGDALYEQFPFAAFVSKTVTLAPRQGNPPPRLWEQPGGMINSIGLPNKGLEGYLREDLPRLAELPVPLIVNVMGSTREDVGRLVAAFAERDEVAALELNVSCPNVKTGLIMGADPAELAGLLDAVRPLTDKPLIVKLTPNCASPADVAAAAEEHGADAVSLINTLRGMAMHPDRPGEPWLGGGTGGVSGPAVRAIALSQVRGGARNASTSPSSAWEEYSQDATRRTSAKRAQILSGSALNRSGTPWPLGRLAAEVSRSEEGFPANAAPAAAASHA